MTDSSGQTVNLEMNCAEVSELAGVYVLGALDAAENAAFAAHLATCAEAHEEVRELGGVVPALASTVDPIDAPAVLKLRVLDAVRIQAGAAQDAATTSPTTQVKPWTMPAQSSVAPPAARRPSPPAWASWGAALAALVILAVVGVSALGALQRADRAEQGAQVLADAIAAFSAPGSSTALLRGSGAQAGASGFAAFSADGRGYLVMVGLPSAPQGQAYQAWYIADGPPDSAGLLTVDDGYAVLVARDPLPGTKVVALTLEPAGGSDQPTTEPFAAGEVRPPA